MRAGPLRRTLHLGIKELVSLAHDPVVVVFIAYAFTVQIVVFARGASIELRNATIAVLDEDRSPLSARLREAFREPTFQPAVAIGSRDLDRALDAGRYTFVLDVPPSFQADLSASRRPTLGLMVDATAVGQAFTGAGVIARIVNDEIRRFGSGDGANDPSPVGLAVRVLYNPNRESRWLMGVMELAITITMLAIVIPGAALLREREHGTVGHLLIMPLSPGEIVLAKVWASTLVLFLATGLCLAVIVVGVLQVPLRGNLALFLAGTLLFQLATAGVGMFIATFARTVPALALLCIIVMVPMMFLSGAWTPREAMPVVLQRVMQLSPLTHYVDFTGAVLFRGAGLGVVWRPLAAIAVIGAAVLAITMRRFRATFRVDRG